MSSTTPYQSSVNSLDMQYPPPPYNSENTPLLVPPSTNYVQLPPPIATEIEGDVAVLGGKSSTPCRVCHLQLSFTPSPKVSLIRCPQCKECTQVGPPPRGKQYLVCPCNALLSASITARAAECPRPHCKRTTILRPPEQGKNRAFCGHCNTLLSYNWSAAVVICPKCRCRSIVNNRKLVSYTLIWFILALIVLGIGVGVTVFTYVIADSTPYGGTYFIMYGPMILGAMLLLRALVYSCLNCNAKKANFIGV